MSATLFLLILAFAFPASAQSVRLPVAGSEPSLRRVKISFEASGHLVPMANETQQSANAQPVEGEAAAKPAAQTPPAKPAAKEIQKQPLRVQASLQYDERSFAGDRQAEDGDAVIDVERLFVRNYSDAQAVIEIGSVKEQPKLRSDRRLVVIDRAGNKIGQFSPLGPLTRDELELLEAPAGGLELGALLPNREVRKGESWPIADDVMARMFYWDSITENTVKAKFVETVDGAARLEFDGRLAGYANGAAAAELEVRAKYSYDLQQRLVTWLALVVQERRDSGHAGPGFQIVGRLRMALVPLAEAPALGDNALAGVPLERRQGSELLFHSSQWGNFSALMNRQWQTILDKPHVTVFRLVEDGQLIAQCNISKLNPLEKGRTAEMEAFQHEIKRALGDTFGEFLEASQETNDEGVRTLRAVAVGTVQQVPIYWIYYQMNHPDGRRVAFVFTMDASLVERFGAADQEIASSIQFLEEQLQEDERRTQAPAIRQPQR